METKDDPRYYVRRPKRRNGGRIAVTVINGLIIIKTLICKIPPNLPLPSGSETTLGRRLKGVPPFAGFDKEGQGEILPKMSIPFRDC